MSLLESAADVHAFTNLSYGLLITQILLYHYIDLPAYPPVEVVATYDSKTFASIGYVLVDNE